MSILQPTDKFLIDWINLVVLSELSKITDESVEENSWNSLLNRKPNSITILKTYEETTLSKIEKNEDKSIKLVNPIILPNDGLFLYVLEQLFIRVRSELSTNKGEISSMLNHIYIGNEQQNSLLEYNKTKLKMQLKQTIIIDKTDKIDKSKSLPFKKLIIIICNTIISYIKNQKKQYRLSIESLKEIIYNHYLLVKKQELFELLETIDSIILSKPIVVTAGKTKKSGGKADKEVKANKSGGKAVKAVKAGKVGKEVKETVTKRKANVKSTKEDIVNIKATNSKKAKLIIQDEEDDENQDDENQDDENQDDENQDEEDHENQDEEDQDEEDDEYQDEEDEDEEDDDQDQDQDDGQDEGVKIKNSVNDIIPILGKLAISGIANEDDEDDGDIQDDSTASTIDNGRDNDEYELEGDTASDSEEELVVPKKSKKTK